MDTIADIIKKQWPGSNFGPLFYAGILCDRSSFICRAAVKINDVKFNTCNLNYYKVIKKSRNQCKVTQEFLIKT
jgi:hypothetical protein